MYHSLPFVKVGRASPICSSLGVRRKKLRDLLRSDGWWLTALISTRRNTGLDWRAQSASTGVGIRYLV